MARSKQDNSITLKIFQKTNYIIGLRIESEHLKEAKITGVEHNDRFYGKHRSRTHNNLFSILKSILIFQQRWTDKETKIGKVREDKPNELNVDEKYGFVYITTNEVNGMRYIGKHTEFGDDYIGSGVEFKKAVKEFGRDNFEREIVAFAYSEEQLNFLEKSYIDMFNAVADPMFYNRAPGGEGWYTNEKNKGIVY